MTVRIASNLLEELQAMAAASPDREICGLLFGSPTEVTGFKPLANCAAQPAVQFELDPAGLIAAHKSARANGTAIIGHYHSHPNGTAAPSRTDADQLAQWGQLWLILTPQGRFGLYHAIKDGPIWGCFAPLDIA